MKFHWTPRAGTHSLVWDEAVNTEEQAEGFSFDILATKLISEELVEILTTPSQKPSRWRSARHTLFRGSTSRMIRCWPDAFDSYVDTDLPARRR